ncbi:hypothetical protein N7495_003629 [Penicillium taxi]|uniref:uncharacterized protein n=1 Tax=Penicillium taxi TaxID=168475 RepID=UPI00254534E4|nr:uncharacterized protein N7495_003629 [Penicillium taxi]KAJ5898885.1 hypothetical protein N7495_003629 [Penicillium taxi]
MSKVEVPQGPVEARSLSSITAIASNPPAYPRNPTHEKLDPLVLYIVRVPGSQDIFLSPVKPATKSSISAEAINASLYYLHVATPEDEALVEKLQQEREAEAQQRREAGEDDLEFSRMNRVRRKPVGGMESAQDDATGLTQNPIASQAPLNPALARSLSRRPVPLPAMPQVSAENMSFSGTPVAKPQSLEQAKNFRNHSRTRSADNQQHPLPALPPSEEPWHQPSEDQPIKTSRWKERFDTMSAGRHSLDSNRPPPPRLPPRMPQSRTNSPPRSSQRPKTAQNNNAGFHITLIRRDPASGTQWNVATISTPSADRNSIDIDISTPGYNRFAGSNETISLASLAANLPAGMIRTSGPFVTPSVAPERPTEQAATGPRKFHRQLCVSKPLDELGMPIDYGNGYSHDGSKLKSGYYVFKSPWNGICTFSSGVNGRSLKCKHMIPRHSPVNAESEPNPAVTVAEIRFNLPLQAANLHYHAARTNLSHTNPTFTHDGPTQDQNPSSKRTSLSQMLNPNTYSRPRSHTGPGTPFTSSETHRHFDPSAILRKTSLRASRFARQNQLPGHRRSTSTSSGGPDSDEDRMDMSLARELAGGGYRGSSAKLGKLLVQEEGIKMLDLVVSASMAVWWRGYYY